MAQEVNSFWAEIKKYEDILANDPISYCFAQLSELYRKIGLLDDAIYVAKRGIEAHPDYVGGHLALGKVYYDKGQKADSRVVLEQVVKMTPENYSAQKLLSQIYLEQNEVILAEKTLETVLALNPDDVESRLSLGALIRSGGTADALSSSYEDEEDLEDAEIVEDDLLSQDRWTEESPIGPIAVTEGSGLATGSEKAVYFDETVVEDNRRGEESAPVTFEGLTGELPTVPDVAGGDEFPCDVARQDAAWDILTEDESKRGDDDLVVLKESTGEPPPVSGAEDALPDTAGPSRDPLTTATLAEIYLAQGFHDQALRIYRELSDESPGNNEVRRRIAEIESNKAETLGSQAGPETAAPCIHEALPVLLPGAASPGSPITETVLESHQDRAVATLEQWLERIERRRACR